MSAGRTRHRPRRGFDGRRRSMFRTVSRNARTIAIFIFGLTVDYSIFLQHAMSNESHGSDVTATAVVVSSLTTILGFGALLFARHPSLSSIGITTVVGIVCGLMASLLIVPVLSRR